jgi:hypothetical protein
MKVLDEYITNLMSVCQDLVLFVLLFSSVEYVDLTPIGALGTGKHKNKEDKTLTNGHRISDTLIDHLLEYFIF